MGLACVYPEDLPKMLYWLPCHLLKETSFFTDLFLEFLIVKEFDLACHSHLFRILQLCRIVVETYLNLGVILYCL